MKNHFLEEFPITVGEDEFEQEHIFKPNCHNFNSDRKGNKHDEISKLKYYKFIVDEELYAFGWYGECNWFGTLCDKDIAGLRVRKGNILIGDNKTLDGIFDGANARFNRWAQGEIFVITDKLIPNARRDDFEQNEAYFKFIETLKETIGKDISKDIREASTKRNNPYKKTALKIEKEILEAKNILDEGFNSSVDKQKTLDALEKAEIELKKIKPPQEYCDEKIELEARLENTILEVEESKKYKLNDISSGIDKKSKKILAVVSDILSLKLAKPLVDNIIDEIKEALNKK